MQGSIAASRVTGISAVPHFPDPDRVAGHRFIDRSVYSDLLLLGIARADIGCRIGKGFFVSAGPSLSYTFSNLRPGHDGKKERHYITAFDLGIGLMF